MSTYEIYTLCIFLILLPNFKTIYLFIKYRNSHQNQISTVSCIVRPVSQQMTTSPFCENRKTREIWMRTSIRFKLILTMVYNSALSAEGARRSRIQWSMEAGWEWIFLVLRYAWGQCGLMGSGQLICVECRVWLGSRCPIFR